MRYSVSELAKLFGISVRTLHYYDEIGLVTPSEVSEAGYRFYNEDSVAALQQVLFYRELEFSLREIASILKNPHNNCTEALSKQRKLLLLKRRHLDELLQVLDETIGGSTMKENKKTAWEELRETEKEYAAEARSRWGDTEEYKVSMTRDKARDEGEKDKVAAAAKEIFDAFAALRTKAPEAPEVQALVRRWQDHITECYYPCTREILAGLGQMYVGDERFTANIDRSGEGTAQLMSSAIQIYCE